MIIAIAAAILGATTLWVLGPIFGWGDVASERHDLAAAERDDLLKSRQEKLAAIKDLEMEYRIGKLTREDFEETRERIASEAVEILKKIDAGAGDARASKPGGKHVR
jgi:hypothetical protein